ncbi:MAG: DUF423 domain-containing protein [Candidatus Poribacteria bacterium]|nr:DUF423 domain-containing protein [Candidatus Poribacteria bacterium]MDE0502700.1 DUF423 domain-containing protein [Candidatus Poribacteria bacterium]
MQRIFFCLGGGFALLSVAIGAFAAHALKTRLSEDMLAIFEIGARYQMYHALGLIAVAWAFSQWNSQLISAAGWLFVAGIVIFSGSLYALSLTGVRQLGAITPIGGLAFIVGWFLLVLAALRNQ